MTENGYTLLALSLDGTKPKFAESVKRQNVDGEELIIYYDMQCPFIYQTIDTIKAYCEAEEILHQFIRKGKKSPLCF